MDGYFENLSVIASGGGSPQARMGNPFERPRRPEDDRCPRCGGIKAWDEELCEECQDDQDAEEI